MKAFENLTLTATPVKKMLLASLSGAFLALGSPGFIPLPGSFLLAWLTVAPLALLVLDPRPARLFLWGLLAGVVGHGAVFYWIFVSVLRMSGGFLFSAAVYAAFVLAFSLATALFLWVLGRCRSWWRTGPALFPFVAGAWWVALEYARCRWGGVPVLMAYTQADWSALIQMADVTGAYGVSFIVSAFGAAAGQALAERRAGSPRPWRRLLPVLALLGASIAYGVIRLSAREAPGPSVVLAQAGVDPFMKKDSTYREFIRTSYTDLTRAELANAAPAKSRPALVIWPETSVPGWMTPGGREEGFMSRWAAETGVPHLVGSGDVDGAKLYNAAFIFDGRGALRGRYRKRHLIPVGETMWRRETLSRFFPFVQRFGNLSAGTAPAVLDSPIGKLGVSICYETAFPHLVREQVKAGAQALVNLSDDAWFQGTTVPRLNYAANVFRAVEFRRALARASNAGLSGVIAPSGKAAELLGVGERGTVSGGVRASAGKTVYARFGDWFVLFCVLGLAVLGFKKRGALPARAPA